MNSFGQRSAMRDVLNETEVLAPALCRGQCVTLVAYFGICIVAEKPLAALGNVLCYDGRAPLSP